MPKPAEVCENCFYWEKLTIPYPQGTTNDDGYCRRNPPGIYLHHNLMVQWPIVFKMKWCGEFKPRNWREIANRRG